MEARSGAGVGSSGAASSIAELVSLPLAALEDGTVALTRRSSLIAIESVIIGLNKE